MSFKKVLAMLFGLATLSTVPAGVSCSDVQAYPGMQFRVEQSFVDLVTEEFFYELPWIVNDVLAPLVPKEIHLFLGFFQIRNIKVSNFAIDTQRAKFSIDEQQRGIAMKWAQVSNWNIHFECWYILFWPLEYRFIVDIFVKEGNLDNGLSIQADTHTGVPEVNFFNTNFDLGQSYVQFSGDFVIAIIGWFANLLKEPIQLLINELLQPLANFVLNDIIIHEYLNDGIFNIAIESNGKPFDTLVVDATMPQQPVFTKDKMDLFADGAIFFKNHGKHFAPPTTPMRFQLDEQNFQLVFSDFTVNSLVESIMTTQFVQIPVNHHLIQEVTGFELTTTLLFAIVPELFYNYGGRNVSLLITPQSGTSVDFSAAKRNVDVHVETLVDWIVMQDATDAKPAEAFQSRLSLDVDLFLDVNATKFTNISISTLSLTGFIVTKDNLGGSVLADEANIMSRLQTYLYLIEVGINSFL